MLLASDTQNENLVCALIWIQTVKNYLSSLSKTNYLHSKPAFSLYFILLCKNKLHKNNFFFIYKFITFFSVGSITCLVANVALIMLRLF